MLPRENIRIDVKFLDPKYLTYRRLTGLPLAEHPGIDINVQSTHGDGDLGYPVVAIAEGKVVHAASHRVWGWVVLIEHQRLPGYPQLWSQYAHLRFVTVHEGQWVLPGEAIGSIGKGDPAMPFLSHLHFELRKTGLAADYWPAMNRAAIVNNYIDPQAYLQQYYDSTWRFQRSSFQNLVPQPDHSSGPYLVNLDPEKDRVWVRKA